LTASCSLPGAAIGFVAVGAVITLIIWFIATGWAWGGRMMGGVYRADNPAGFWTSIVQYVAIVIVGLAFLWFAFLSECFRH
jgi:threonine/homoserine/homoserine lactone efflux protein